MFIYCGILVCVCQYFVEIPVITADKLVYANIHMCIGVYKFVDVNNRNKNIIVDKFVVPMMK